MSNIEAIVKVISANYALNPNIKSYLIDANATSIAVTIPTPNFNGITYKLIRFDMPASANTVTITPATGLIDGSASYQLDNKTAINIISFAGSWF